jgi:hypothetical protein
VLRRRRTTTRVTGPPTSSNGASSMHVWWDSTGGPAGEVSATLEVVEPPTVPQLYFWALQATFVDARARPLGTAHLGLQWYAVHPGGTAVNWGGYRPNGAGELSAVAPSALPSATGNPNTRDFAWRPGTPYRLTITADGTGAVTDVARGETTVVRRLAVEGATALTAPVVWSEVFARCDDPPTAVRWSSLGPAPGALHATYQSFANGGCTNTDVEVDLDHLVITQRTNTERQTPEGRLA